MPFASHGYLSIDAIVVYVNPSPPVSLPLKVWVSIRMAFAFPSKLEMSAHWVSSKKLLNAQPSILTSALFIK